MIIVDVQSGRVVHPGDRLPESVTFDTSGREVERQPGPVLLSVQEKLLSARASFADHKGRIFSVPLIVRYTHPKFFGRKVGFIPS